MKITVNKIFYKPIIEFEAVDILGQKYHKKIVSPNLYVVDTTDEIQEGSNVEFKHDSILYTLEGISVGKSDGKVFIECINWSEEFLSE